MLLRSNNQQQIPNELPGIYHPFFNKEYLSDCQISSSIAPNNWLHCHRIILAASSKFYDNIFKESSNNTTDKPKIIAPKCISPINDQVTDQFQSTISFIYSDQTEDNLYKLQLNEKTAYGFLSYMSSLEISKGIEIVSDFIGKKVLNQDTCVETLLNAIKFNSKPLLDHSIELIRGSFSYLIKKEKAYQNLLALPYEAMFELLSHENLEVEDESIVANFVAEYIQFREKLEPNPINQPQPVEPKKEIKPEIPVVESKPPENASGDQPKENNEENKAPEGEEKPPVEEKAPDQQENKPKLPNEVIDLEIKAQERLKNYLLSNEEKIQLIRLIRLPYLSHEVLIKTASKQIFAPFKDIFMESLSAKLNTHEPVNESNYSINTQPRASYRSGSSSHAIYLKLSQFAMIQEKQSLQVPIQDMMSEQNKSIREKPRLNIQNPIQSNLSSGLQPPQRPVSANKDFMAYQGRIEPIGQPTQQNIPYINNIRSLENQIPARMPSNERPYNDMRMGLNGPGSTNSQHINPSYISPGPNMSSYKPIDAIGIDNSNGNYRQYNPGNRTPELQKNSGLMPGRELPNYSKQIQSASYVQNNPKKYTENYLYHQGGGDGYSGQFQMNNYGQSSELNQDNDIDYEDNRQMEGFINQTPTGYAARFEPNQLMRSTIHTKAGSPSRLKGENEMIEFIYKYDFDDNGILYFLGTLGKQKPWQNPHKIGQVKCFFSSLGRGNLEDFVGRIAVNCRTLNEPNSFMGVDLGKNRFLIPSCYTIRNRLTTTHVMMNWVFEGSIDSNEWYTLDKRIFLSNNEQLNQMLAKEREELKIKGYTSTWAVDPTQIKKIQKNIEDTTKSRFYGFRYFRITQNGKNSGGSFNLGLSGLEMYGVGCSPSWFFQVNIEFFVNIFFTKRNNRKVVMSLFHDEFIN